MIHTGHRGFSIRVRLVAAFAVFLTIILSMAGVGAWRLQELDRTTQDMASNTLRLERLVGDWLSHTRSNAVRATVLTRSDDEDLRRLLAPEMEATSKRISEIQQQIEKLATTPDARALFLNVGEKRKAYLSIRQNVLEKKKAGQGAEAIALMDSGMLPALRTYVESIRAMNEHYGKAVELEAVQAHGSATSGRNVLAALCAASIALAIVFCWLIVRSITRPLDEAVQVAKRVAAGELDVEIRIASKDEMGVLLQSLLQMAQRLRELVGEVASSARTVADTSAQIAQGNQDLSQRTEEQASTLEETASSMEELTSIVAQNAGNAREASQLAVTASQVAQKGGAVVGQVVSTMTGISDSSRKIADIIGVIDAIAFQTNILALNAAVEAARAGEQGRGFAVVATEVRNLAQRSAQAAKEIKGLIGDSVSRVETGARLVDDAGKTMEEIVSSVTKVSVLIAEIAAASQEQSSGIEQVNKAVTQMDQVVQQNATLVEEATAATESMKGQADALLELVSSFKLGATAAAAPVGPETGRAQVANAQASQRAPSAIKFLPRKAYADAQGAMPLAPAGQWQKF